MDKKMNEKGIALIASYAIIVAIGVLTMAAAYRAGNSLKLARRNTLAVEAVYLAEAGIEYAALRLVNEVANYQTEPISFTDSNTTLLSDYTIDYSCDLVPGSTEQVVTDSSGIATYIRHYQIEATASHNQFDVAIRVNQIIARKKTATFQHAVFYANDLEILPGPDMTLSGRIHSNEDIYIGSGNTLTIDTDYLYSAGNIFKERKNDGSVPAGDVSIREKDSNPADYYLMDEVGDPSPLDSNRADWSTESQNRWKGTVKSGIHGVTGLAVPVVGSIQPDGYYSSNANVKVANGTIFKGGILLVEGADIPPGTIVTSTSFYNNREGQTIRMTDVDLKKLAGYDVGDPEGSPSYPNNLPANGLMYATRDDAGAGEQAGVRLKNGGQIYRSAGLTVVSNDPVYLQGDYNNVSKTPSAVICDAVNFLSNNWNDSTSTQNLDTRVASNTEVNVAMIAGTDTTTTGNYNGGLENYPRMHETWSNKTLSIRGSFVSLWDSQIAQGDWVYGGSQYTAPGRNWDYDLDFNDVSKIPPFTPHAVEAEALVWWKN